jgi:hypothetical protein
MRLTIACQRRGLELLGEHVEHDDPLARPSDARQAASRKRRE